MMCAYYKPWSHHEEFYSFHTSHRHGCILCTIWGITQSCTIMIHTYTKMDNDNKTFGIELVVIL